MLHMVPCVHWFVVTLLDSHIECKHSYGHTFCVWVTKDLQLVSPFAKGDTLIWETTILIWERISDLTSIYVCDLWLLGSAYTVSKFLFQVWKNCCFHLHSENSLSTDWLTRQLGNICNFDFKKIVALFALVIVVFWEKCALGIFCSM